MHNPDYSFDKPFEMQDIRTTAERLLQRSRFDQELLPSDDDSNWKVNLDMSSSDSPSGSSSSSSSSDSSDEERATKARKSKSKHTKSDKGKITATRAERNEKTIRFKPTVEIAEEELTRPLLDELLLHKYQNALLTS